MQLGNSGLPFLAIGLGVILSLITAHLGTKKYLQRKAARGGIEHPEDRLLYALPAAITAPISIFWLAWTCYKSIHWIVPTLSGVMYANPGVNGTFLSQYLI